MTRPRDLSVAVGAMAVAKEQVTKATVFAVEQVVMAVVRAVMWCMRWCGEVRSQRQMQSSVPAVVSGKTPRGLFFSYARV